MLLMGQLTISMAVFNSQLLNYQMVAATYGDEELCPKFIEKKLRIKHDLAAQAGLKRDTISCDRREIPSISSDSTGWSMDNFTVEILDFTLGFL